MRTLSLAEEQVIAAVLHQATSKRGSIKQKVELAEPGNSTKRSLEIEIIVKPGAGNSIQRLLYVDGLLRVTARELITKRLFAFYGCDVQIQRPNGVFLTMARDPNRIRPAVSFSNQTVPNPKNCKCVNWGNPHPGRHHPVCEFNARAPVDEQALTDHDRLYNPDQANMFRRIETEVLKMEPEAAPATPKVSPALAGVLSRESINSSFESAKASHPLSLISPADCVCKDWARPAGADPLAHHPICEHREAWEASNPPASSETEPDETFLLVDLTTGKVMREASAEEVQESIKAEGSLGMRAVTLGDKVYAVISKPIPVSASIAASVAAEA